MDNPATWATVVIAAFTAALFTLQFWQHSHNRRVARASYQLSLFDRRMETYLAIEDMLGAFMTKGRPSVEAVVKLRHEARHADFLFPEEPLKFINEIIEKTFEHENEKIKHEPLRKRAFGGEQLTEDETQTKEQALARMHEIQGWFVNVVTSGRLKAEFGPYLKLPESL